MERIAHRPGRRRFLTVSAAAAGLSLWPARLPLETDSQVPPATLRIWNGVALGADASLQINHPDRAIADRLIERALTEVARLEKIFSLYREESALSMLNREGVLTHPPPDLVRLLSEADRYTRLTGGAFDVTIQPLWRLYAGHFARADADPRGPHETDLAAALARVGAEAIAVDEREIRFRRPGMAITLNGIAQGYITDRVTELLRADGLDRSLVDMGEVRCLGDHPRGGAWQVGLADPKMPGRIAETIAIRNLAVASSGGYGLQFDAACRFNHILDPRTGASSARYLGVSVIASTATMADALSTALSLMPRQQGHALIRQLGISAHYTHADGSRTVVAG